ncbi:MAG: hypothetical protein LBE82_06770 [Chitinophagaceae bacterium]|jgi:hypothetical protein|nr:hypothetical protein [Chitinophagaceae bacterium]
MNKKYLMPAIVLWIAASCTIKQKELPLLAKMVNTGNIDEGASFAYDAQNRLVSITSFNETHSPVVKDTITYNEKGEPATLTRYERRAIIDKVGSFYENTIVHKFVYNKTNILCDDSIIIAIDEQGNLKHILAHNTITCTYDSAGNLQKLTDKQNPTFHGNDNPNEKENFSGEYTYDKKNGAFKNCATPRWFFTWMEIYNRHSDVELDFASTNNNRISAKNIYNGQELYPQMYYYERRYNGKFYPVETIWLEEKQGVRQPLVVYKYEYILGK